jgi:hypothetical protein
LATDSCVRVSKERFPRLHETPRPPEKSLAIV